MIPILKRSIRAVIGVILIIFGFVGMFIPIPVVPFFLLIFVGLAVMGVKQPWVERARTWFENRRSQPRTFLRKIGSAFFIIIVIIVCFAAVAPSIVQVMKQGYIYSDISEIPKTDIAIVLGASVVKGEPSLILEERLRAAINLYSTFKVSKILVTGDGIESDYDETTAMREYLLGAGIPAEDILVDDNGVDTYTSIYRAKNEFGSAEATIVSQRFHLPRALLIAHQTDMDSYGFVAENSTNPTREYFREVPAILKAVLDLAVMRQP